MRNYHRRQQARREEEQRQRDERRVYNMVREFYGPQLTEYAAGPNIMVIHDDIWPEQMNTTEH